MKWQLWHFDGDGEGNPPELVMTTAFLDEAIAAAEQAYPDYDVKACLERVGGRYAELPYGTLVLVPVE